MPWTDWTEKPVNAVRVSINKDYSRARVTPISSRRVQSVHFQANCLQTLKTPLSGGFCHG